MDAPSELSDILAQLMKLLVDEPHEVFVEAALGSSFGIIIRVKVSPRDIGKVIGRNGRMARSLRQLIDAVGMSQHCHLTLDIVQPDKEESLAV